MKRITLQEFAQDIVAEFGTTGWAPLCSIEGIVQWAAQERASIRELIEMVACSPEPDCAYCPMPGGCGAQGNGNHCRVALCAYYGLPDDPRQMILATNGLPAAGPEGSKP